MPNQTPPEGEKFTLYGSFTSPFARHCRMVILQNWPANRLDFQEADYDTSAANSPTQKVPYFRHGELFLTDSASILRYVREQAGQPFLPTVADLELFSHATTLLDATINLFLLEKEGVTPQNTPYLARQTNRIRTGLAALNTQQAGVAEAGQFNDAHLRLMCYLSWALFRGRITLDAHPNLIALLAAADALPQFAETAPPA